MNIKYAISLIITISTASLYAAEKGSISDLISRLSPEALTANPFNNVYAPMVQAMQANNANAAQSTQTSGGSFWENAGSAVGNTILTALAGAIVKSAWDAAIAAPDEQKQLQLQIQALELERKKNDDLLIQRFRELNGKYLACKLRKGNCVDMEQEFVMACGQLAMDVIKQTSSN